ncbi:gas vesicle protein GvpN [Salibacterium aidingense]|uniref:gas vesicle protein GvpN n=1 Tax=Salibacterium aidingense TaxID=384933 RepID=UPI000403D089|nr:gas vesicle protein GvpN [Salibacterium aidingense]
MAAKTRKNNAPASRKSTDSADGRNSRGAEEQKQSYGKKQIHHVDSFVSSKKIEEILKRSLQYLNIGYPVHFTGASGVGKTTMAMQLAKRTNQPVVLLNGNRSLSNVDLIGGFSGYTSNKFVDNYVRRVYKREDTLTEHWKAGHLFEAAENGWTVIYDEFTRTEPEINNILLPLLEEGILPLYGAKQKHYFKSVHPDLKMIFTSNPEEYSGVHATQDALLDRMITIPVEESDRETKVKVLKESTNVAKNEAELIIRFIDNMQAVCEEDQSRRLSFRSAVMIATISRQNKIKINPNQSDFLKVCVDTVGVTVRNCKHLSDMKETEQFIQQEIKEI